MEIKEAERVMVSRPVASRPNSVNFRSFSSTNVLCEATAAAIRPKTVRFKPISGQNLSVEPPDKEGYSSQKPIVVYKPLAKLVSRTTISMLASMHENCGELVREPLLEEESNNLLPSTSMVQQPANESTQVSNFATQVVEDDSKMLSYAANCDRPSYDGYNWRKYGQKQVKGSEYPRSYYKCTYPNCMVKKKVERSFDGKIAEIVYNGEHNHSKPLPLKRNMAEMQGNSAFGEEGSNLPWNSERHDQSETNPPDVSPPPNNPKIVTPDDSCGNSGEFDGGSKEQTNSLGESRSKRRKKQNQGDGCLVVHSSMDTETMGDGFRWRKYGQKVVKGNPYPRSYYRCTSSKCNVRKHVERALDDPTTFVTTYEGKHNHDMPLQAATSDTGSPAHVGVGKL